MRLIESKKITLTPKLAQSYLEFNSLPEQQMRFRERRVDFIKKLIEEGLFRYASVAFAVVEKRKIMVNGQHTCKTVTELGKSIPAFVEWYECEDMIDVSQLFRQYDASWSSRTSAQLVAFETHAQQFEWCPRVSQLLLAALRFNDNSVEKMSVQEKVGLLAHHPKEGAFLNRILFGENGKTRCRFLMRAPVCAAILRTYEKSQSDSLSFWNKVGSGENLLRKDPELHLREFLLSIQMKKVRAIPGKTATAHEILYRCITAWNSRRSGGNRSMGLKYFADKQIPKAM